MTIETSLVVMFLGEVLVIVVGMSLIIKLIPKVARKLDEAVKLLKEK